MRYDPDFWKRHYERAALSHDAEWIGAGLSMDFPPQYDPRKINHAQNALTYPPLLKMPRNVGLVV